MVDLLNSNGLRVAAYLIAAALCALAGVRDRQSRESSLLALFWFALATLLLVMGLSRMFDLAATITDWGRDYARDQGWYNDRREYQRLVVEGILAAGVAFGSLALVWFFRSAYRERPLAFFAIVFLMTYVLIRAVSLHQIDAVLYNRPIEGVRIASLLELAGLAVLSLSAGIAAMQWRLGARRGDAAVG